MSAAALSEAPQWLRDPTRIAGLLHRASSAHSRIAVRVGHSETELSSLVLGMDAASGQLFIDEPYPAPPAVPPPGTVIRLAGKLDGGRFEFQTLVAQPVTLGNGLAYLLRMPVLVAWFERRGAFRLAIPAGLQLPPATFRSDRTAFRGQLVDLSRNGAGAVVSSSIDAQVGSRLVCSLSLPTAQMHTDVEIRSLAGVLGRQRMGLRFRRLTAEQDEKVSAAISQMQRQQIRERVQRA